MSRAKHLNEVKALLVESGLEYRIETGGSHQKVFLQDRMVLVMPKARARDIGRQQLNNLATLRRAIREARPAPVINGSVALPAMATALVAAEKQRRMDMDNVRFGSGQTALAMTVEEGHPLANKRLRVSNFTENSDGSLRVVFHEDARGVKFTGSTSNPGVVNYSETWKHSAKHVANMPRFGKTSCGVEMDGNHIVVHVPAQREPLVIRALKSAEERGATVPVPASGPNRDEFRDAVRTVNAFKARMGEALELRINEEGQLRGAIMEEFG